MRKAEAREWKCFLSYLFRIGAMSSYETKATRPMTMGHRTFEPTDDDDDDDTTDELDKVPRVQDLPFLIDVGTKFMGNSMEGRISINFR